MDLSECSVPRDEWIRSLIISLGEAKEYAVRAGFDLHFLSEIKHLISTAEANKE